MSQVNDVIQVGYGPVSQALALMLGQQRRAVAICERWTVRYPLPRAVCIDHELYRVLAAVGMSPALPAVCERGPLYQWFNADWQELLTIDWSKDSISGGPEVNFVHQPTLEEALDQAVAVQPTVETHLGWEAISIRQDTDLAHVTLRNRSDGAEKTLSARFVVGCDGANSIVRETIGGTRQDHGFEADWLVIDVLLKQGVSIGQLGIPAAGQYCNPLRPTTIVPAGIRGDRTYRRWEFMRLPGERNEDLEREDRVWELLKPWASPENVELVRHKVYNFRSLIADRWRDGRLLIAGDAAHVMPPFMGQGMCSGMRDAWNLAWKLALVLDGRADPRLLDTYQPERRPHVAQLVEASIYLGKIICIPDPVRAAERDHAFLTGTVEPPPPFPHLTDGLLHREPDGRVSPGAGLLSPHVQVQCGSVTGRLDAVVGLGFLVIALEADPETLLDATTRTSLVHLPTRYIALGVPESPRHLIDLDNRLTPFMQARGWSVMIVRPDFYVYGGASSTRALPALLKDLLADLTVAGLQFS